MKKSKHSLAASTVFIAAILFSGCTSLNNAHMALIEHPKRTVKYPAHVGETVGTIVGIPVGIVLMIPTMIVANLLPLDEETKAWSGLYPFAACRDLGTIVIGGIPWCLVGWWGLPEPKPEADEERTCRLPRGSYVEDENGGMIVGEDQTTNITTSGKDEASQPPPSPYAAPGAAE
jgi:hypothetical protein